MSDSPDEEAARRNAIVDEFGASSSPETAFAADVALDWKANYGDGHLTRWTVAEVEELALGWCPRKLSLPVDESAAFLGDLGRFFRFLSARGLLEDGSAGPEQLASWCARNTERFVTEMGDPANYGMAKSLFAGVGGLDGGLPADADELRALMEQVQGLDPEQVDTILAGAGGAPEIGPVAVPADDERAASAADAPILERMRRLHEYCAAPGRTLTATGNLRVVDARALVELLDTGDDLEPAVGSVRSVEDLPRLAMLVRYAVRAGVVRRRQGRLVAVVAWRRLGPLPALDRLVDAAVDVGLDRTREDGGGAFSSMLSSLDDAHLGLLFGLLDAGLGGQEAELDDLEDAVVGDRFGFLRSVATTRVRRQLDVLDLLGVIVQRDVRVESVDGIDEARGGRARLTPAGVGVAVRLLEDDGVVVTRRVDPTTLDADGLIALMERIGPEAWTVDATTWTSSRGGTAASEMGDALGREPDAETTLLVLGALDDALGAQAMVVVRRLLGGRWDGAAALWLADHGDTSLIEEDPDRPLRGSLDVLGVILDVEGPEAAVDALVADHEASQILGLLDRLWRLDHPRVAEILEAAGRHHDDKTVAKQARKVLAKHRSRSGTRR